MAVNLLPMFLPLALVLVSEHECADQTSAHLEGAHACVMISSQAI